MNLYLLQKAGCILESRGGIRTRKEEHLTMKRNFLSRISEKDKILRFERVIAVSRFLQSSEGMAREWENI